MRQLAEIDRQDAENRAELDQYRKTFPETVLAEVEESFRQQQMTRRGNREELGNTLDDAEDHRPYCIRHHVLVRSESPPGLKKPGSSRLFLALLQSQKPAIAGCLNRSLR